MRQRTRANDSREAERRIKERNVHKEERIEK
jgi:hypothetical protein